MENIAKDGKIKLCVSVKPLWDLKKDYPLVIISNADSSFIRTSIKRLGLRGLFDKVYGSDKFSPAPKGVLPARLASAGADKLVAPKGVPPARLASAGADKGGKDEMMAKLFKKMKLKPGEVVYVGDRFSDIDYARKAGCVAVAIHNKASWSNLKTIKKEKPDYLIKDFYGLKKVINSIAQ